MTLIGVLVGVVLAIGALYVVLRPVELLGEWLEDRNICSSGVVYGSLWVLLSLVLPFALYFGLR